MPARGPRSCSLTPDPVLGVRRGALRAVVAGAVAVGIAYASAWLPGGAPTWASWGMVGGIATILPGTLLLGALRPGRPSRTLLITAILLAVMLGTGFGTALLLPAETSEGALWLGLPRRAAIVIYGIGLLPILLLPIVFAHDFRGCGLDAAALSALREECEALRHASPEERHG